VDSVPGRGLFPDARYVRDFSTWPIFKNIDALPTDVSIFLPDRCGCRYALIVRGIADYSERAALPVR
jgi:hypothetical protein